VRISDTPLGYLIGLVELMLSVLWHGLRDAFLMAWDVWWALVLGFAISAVVQAWVPRRQIEASLSGSGADQWVSQPR
jgi:uncharacterized membrane protein YraQ (UPF0718 family)